MTKKVSTMFALENMLSGNFSKVKEAVNALLYKKARQTIQQERKTIADKMITAGLKNVKESVDSETSERRSAKIRAAREKQRDRMSAAQSSLSAAKTPEGKAAAKKRIDAAKRDVADYDARLKVRFGL